MLKLLSKHIAVWSIICDDSTYMWTFIIKAENSFSSDVIYYTHNVGIVSQTSNCYFSQQIYAELKCVLYILFMVYCNASFRC
jgi:hypothetical protein